MQLRVFPANRNKLWGPPTPTIMMPQRRAVQPGWKRFMKSSGPVSSSSPMPPGWQRLAHVPGSRACEYPRPHSGKVGGPAPWADAQLLIWEVLLGSAGRQSGEGMLGWQWPYWDGTKDLLLCRRRASTIPFQPQTGLESLLTSDGPSCNNSG